MMLIIFMAQDNVILKLKRKHIGEVFVKQPAGAFFALFSRAFFLASARRNEIAPGRFHAWENQIDVQAFALQKLRRPKELQKFSYISEKANDSLKSLVFVHAEM